MKETCTEVFRTLQILDDPDGQWREAAAGMFDRCCAYLRVGHQQLALRAAYEIYRQNYGPFAEHPVWFRVVQIDRTEYTLSAEEIALCQLPDEDS